MSTLTIGGIPLERPTTLRYPAKTTGGIPGKKLPHVIGYGSAELVTHISSDGRGELVRKREVIGTLVRDPRWGWSLLDLVGNVIAFGLRQMEVAGHASSLPSPAGQAAHLDTLPEFAWAQAVDAPYAQAAE